MVKGLLRIALGVVHLQEADSLIGPAYMFAINVVKSPLHVGIDVVHCPGSFGSCHEAMVLTERMQHLVLHRPNDCNSFHHEAIVLAHRIQALP